MNADFWPKISKKFCIFLAYFWPNHWYLEERKGFLHVLLVPTNDNNWVIVNSRPKHWVKWQEMGENCFLKGKNGQFYSIKWLKYGFSQNRPVFFIEIGYFVSHYGPTFIIYMRFCQFINWCLPNGWGVWDFFFTRK